jgi:hypothetical protein
VFTVQFVIRPVCCNFDAINDHHGNVAVFHSSTRVPPDGGGNDSVCHGATPETGAGSFLLFKLTVVR